MNSLLCRLPGKSYWRAGMIALIMLTFVQTKAKTTLPTFEESSCPMELPAGLVEGQQIICGYLTVAADRSSPENGTYRLAVAILKAKNTNSSPDPVIFLAGGPGQSALGFEDYWSTFPTLENRDFILIDPRGTGFSEPDMDCSEIEFPRIDTVERPATNEMRREANLIWTAECRDLLLSRGIDLTQFNTATWSADIADLRTALELEEINLYGVSYGAYWALGTVRDYPEGIRTITLDSVSPQPIDHHGEIGLRTDTAFKLLFKACADDVACAARFPNLSTDFYAFVESLRQQPVRLPTAEINWNTDASFIRSAYNALYFSNRYPILPLAMEQLVAKNWEVAIQLGGQVNNFGVGQAVLNSVICHDEIPFTDAARFDASLEQYPYLASYLYDAATFVEICNIWGVGQAGMIEAEPVVSDIPALILAGTFDPTSSPAYGRTAAESLSNSTYVEFPTIAHAVTFYADCARLTMTAFINDPGVTPDLGCVADVPPISFETDIIINRGIFQMAKSLLLETSLPLAGLTLLSILTFGIALFAFPIHAWRTRKSSRTRTGLMHLTISWLLALTAVAFVLYLGIVVIQTVQVNQELLLFGLPRPGAPVFVLLWAAAGVFVAMVVIMLIRTSMERRVYPAYLIFTGVSIIFMVMVGAWGMFG